jgi:CspA family cold shock protein
MTTGRISALRSEKGFGFIAGTPGATGTGDIFFHHTALIDSTMESLREGQEVSFEVEPDPRDASRSRARDVRVVEA